jgi:hypothetical protein
VIAVLERLIVRLADLDCCPHPDPSDSVPEEADNA